jgi:hypothetical protein
MESIISLILPLVFYYAIFRFIKSALGGSVARRRTVDAMIVKKRLSCDQHHHGVEVYTNHERTNYFITFQLEKTQRIELQVKESQYDLLFDGERGKLTYRGKRFIRFREN